MTAIQEYFIKKGTKLYRRSKDKMVYSEMFFGFCPFGTYSSYYYEEPIQLWVTKCDIKGNLMLKDISNKFRLKSSILDIYKSFVSNDITDIIEVKKFGPKRENLLNYFIKQEINNWISSVEDKYEMELLLFSSIEKNTELVEYLTEIDSKLDYEELNSFDYSRLNSSSMSNNYKF